MKKDAYYFPHDSNARNDERISYLRSKYGLSAYAIYFLIIEIMHEQSDGKLSCKLIDGLCQQLNVDKTLLNDFYFDAIECELFKTDGEKYWSNRVLRNKAEFEEKRLKKSIAGIKGNISRWHNKENNTTQSQCDNNVIATQSQNIAKKSKVKKSKEKNINTAVEKSTGDFIDTLLNIFCLEYKISRNLDFIISKDKDRKAIANLLKHYKSKNPEKSTDETLQDFTNLFKQAVIVDDAWLFNNYSPTLLNSRINSYMTFINNKEKTNANSNKSDYAKRLTLTVQDLERSAYNGNADNVWQ